MRSEPKFVYSGFIIPGVFWVTMIGCGYMTENYNHFTNLVSELGAIGTQTQYLFTTGLVLCSVLSLFFILGLYRIAKETGLHPLPIWLILTFSFSILGAAIFPLPLKLHGILGSPVLLLPLSPLLCMVLWKEDKIPNLKFSAGLIFLIMLLGFLTFTPAILDHYFGLKQRFFHVGWSLWFVYLSLKFLQLEKMNRKESPLPGSIIGKP